MGDIIVVLLISLSLLPKSALEAAYFKDRESAKKTFVCWVISFGSLLVALCFTLLLNHFGKV